MTCERTKPLTLRCDVCGRQMTEDDNSEVIARFDCFAEVRAAARKRGWESDNWQPLASYVCPTCQAPKPLPLPEVQDWWSFIDVPARRQRMEAVPVYEAALRLVLKTILDPETVLGRQEFEPIAGRQKEREITQLAATVRRALEIGGVKP